MGVAAVVVTEEGVAYELAVAFLVRPPNRQGFNEFKGVQENGFISHDQEGSHLFPG